MFLQNFISYHCQISGENVRLLYSFDDLWLFEITLWVSDSVEFIHSELPWINMNLEKLYLSMILIFLWYEMATILMIKMKLLVNSKLLFIFS